MIFGFNTDVKYGTAIYHVQSEARENELLLQTQVFVKGRCIGKRATSYAEKLGEPGFSDEQMHELLKDQHRRMVEAVRAGRIEMELEGSGEAAKAPAQPAASAPAAAGTAGVAEEPTGPGKRETGTEASAPPASGERPEAAAAAKPANGAAAAVLPRLTGEEIVGGKGLNIECSDSESVYQDGIIHLRIQVSENEQPAAGAQLTWRLTAGHVKLQQAYATADSSGTAEIQFRLTASQMADAAVLLQASHRDKSASRRFRFRT